MNLPAPFCGRTFSARLLTACARLLPACACLLVAGCDNGPPTMPASTDAWHAADLPLINVGSSLTAISFAGPEGHILGAAANKAGSDYLLLSRDPEGHWLRTQLADPPDNGLLLDLAVGALGIVAGGALPQDLDPCLVYDERGAAPATIARAGLGINAIDGDDALMVAGGTGTGGVLWASRAPGQWLVQTTPLDATRECGLVDVFVGHGRALACGFDEGADTLQVVLTLDEAGAAWRRVPLGAGVGALTLKCVAVDADGAILVGGLAGGGTPRAFLRLRSPAGDWSTLDLPDVDLIGGVNDVLPLGGGNWLVACGGEGGSGLATVLRVDGGAVRRELTPFHGAVLQIARDAAGRLHAVGHRLTPGAGLRQALLLVRD